MSSTQDWLAVGRHLYLGGSVVRVDLEQFGRWLNPLPPPVEALPATRRSEEARAASSARSAASKSVKKTSAPAPVPAAPERKESRSEVVNEQQLHPRYFSIVKYFCGAREDADHQVRRSRLQW